MIKQQVGQGNLQHNQINYIPSKYSLNLNNYNRSQMFSILPYISAICKTSNYGANYPVFKVLKAIAKLFMLNQIETIFLAFLVKQTRWNIGQRIIVSNAGSVRGIICTTSDDVEYKSLVLYLMVCSYTVKYFLNEDQADQLIDEANRVCPNFKAVFQHWAKKYNHVTSKISPRVLNRVYKQLYHKSRIEQQDFNRMVDAIIQISPAYNPEKTKIVKEQAIIKPTKGNSNGKVKKQATFVSIVKPKKNQIQYDAFQNAEELQNSKIKRQSFQTSNSLANINAFQNVFLNSPLFSSSGIFNLLNQGQGSRVGNGGFQQLNFNENQAGFNQVGFSANLESMFADNVNNSFINQMIRANRPHKQSFTSLLNSSFDGIPQNFSIKADEQECQDLMIGLQDGQSQENIYFEHGANQDKNKGSHGITISSGANIRETKKSHLGTSKGPQQGPFHSVITLKKGSSFHEK